jgi:hypothetical protein
LAATVKLLLLNLTKIEGNKEARFQRCKKSRFPHKTCCTCNTVQHCNTCNAFATEILKMFPGIQNPFKGGWQRSSEVKKPAGAELPRGYYCLFAGKF